MKFSNKFICASNDKCSFEKHENAPYIRKSFLLPKKPQAAEITISGQGFYELYINGKNITKGALAPYISNPDDICYYDNYDVYSYLGEGENVIGIILGNGFYNNFGGSVWDFEKAKWCGAPRVALNFSALVDDETIEFEADKSFRTHPSPIIFDDYRMGVRYDARLEQNGWAEPGFDDSDWKNALIAEMPRGDAKICEAEPIVVSKKIKPVSITKCNMGYLYDFGVNAAGVCRLEIEGKEGQQIQLEYAERLDENGEFYKKNIVFQCIDTTELHMEYEHKNIYICSGKGKEVFVPKFVYFGFRYVLVRGIEENQATENLLTYLVMNSDLKERADFECSNDTLNKLQKMTRISDLANFYYFPTDCPHREKNGWTGDASMSSEHMLLNLTAEKSLKEWLCNIRKAQNEKGALPGIVPTGGWGFEWGNGPAWDSVCVNLPYYIYKFTGDESVLYDNADMIFRYLNYITTRINENGFIAIGLSDWCQPVKYVKINRAKITPEDRWSAPLEFTDTAMIIDMCKKASFIFDKTERDLQKEFAEKLWTRLRKNVREKMIDFETMTVYGNCQTSQALAIAFNIFEENEMPRAIERLVEIIHKEEDKINVGMIGLRYIFRVLCDYGYADLAIKMITRPDYPSYGNWVEKGATSLWEDFEGNSSRNHHFFGDISALFIEYFAGIKPNPNMNSINEIEISPSFARSLKYAKAFYNLAQGGKVCLEWKRENENIILEVSVPEKICANILLKNGYTLENGKNAIKTEGGKYIIKQH